MASERSLPATRIVGIIEVVVLARVRTECWVVDFRRQCQWCTAAPPTDQLRGEQFPFFLGTSVRLKKSIEGADARLIFTKAHVSAVLTEYVRLWHGQRKTGLAGISEDELPGLDRLSLARKRIDATALDCGLVDTVFVTHGIEVARLRAEILDSQNADARNLVLLASDREDTTMFFFRIAEYA